MTLGMITCNYFMRIYDYKKPEDFNWAKMCDKYRSEFMHDDLIGLAKEIYLLGYENIELWEPTFSHKIYSPQQAEFMANELKAIGFKNIVYCIGGWGKHDIDNIENAYIFANALGAKVITGCISKNDADCTLAEVSRCATKYNIKYAIENHPDPSIENPRNIYNIMMKYENVGANIDCGIYYSLGYDVLAATDLLKDKIYHVHFKDTIIGKEECFPIGDGDAPMDKLYRKLNDLDYTGMISVEFEYLGDPSSGLKKSFNYIKSIV